MQQIQKQFALVLTGLCVIALLTLASTAKADMCEPSWHSLSTYKPGSKISFLEVNYRANYTSAGVVPSSNSGTAQQGKVWTKIGVCGVKAQHELGQLHTDKAQKVAGR